MVRTFICRNGLHILTKSGITAFENYAITQLSNWNMSTQAMNKWLPFFTGWAKYCSSSTMMDMSLPALTSKNYLYHYKRFEELYANGQFQTNMINDVPTFCGLIVIVGSCKNDLMTLAMAVSSELHCSKVLDTTKINETDMLLSRQRSGGGFICVAEFETPVKGIRSLAKEYQESIFIVIIQRRQESEGGGSTIDNNNMNINNSPKLQGMMQAWKKTRCKLMVELPIESTMQLDVDTTIDYLRNNDTTRDILDRLKACGVHGDIDERPGLVVYFPSIPGSGKSSLCRDITADTLLLDVSNNDREVVIMEGDQTVGKFYQVVTKQRLTKPSSIVILDKNVTPTSFVSVDTVCRQSQGSLAVPVLPMGMVDTYVSKESSSFLYPLSLQFLAVCMSRVLNRQAATHPGKLDAATETACMVVVKFYCFFCNMSATRLKEKLLNIGYQGKVLFIPFFKDDVLLNLPNDLKEVLEDAVILQTCDDKKICKADKETIANMENKLRVSITNNRQYIDSLTVSVEESRSVFITELTKMIASLPNKLVTTGPELKQEAAGSIKIASLDFDISVVQSIIDNLRASIPYIDQYFSQREAHKTNDEDDESICRFITSVHCTYAHCSEVSQEAMLVTFQPLIGTTAEMKATALLYSEKIAALELEIPNFDPKPRNIFPHITLWCFEGIGAHESNNLPDMVKMNMATRVELTEPVILKGVFSFWYN